MNAWAKLAASEGHKPALPKPPVKTGRPRTKDADRLTHLKDRCGWTYARIGRLYGMHRESVFQIVKRTRQEREK